MEWRAGVELPCYHGYHGVTMVLQHVHPLRLTFQCACPGVAFRSMHTHMGSVSVLSRTYGRGKASIGAYRNRAGVILPEKEAVLTP
jgi:hypothetical protein